MKQKKEIKRAKKQSLKAAQRLKTKPLPEIPIEPTKIQKDVSSSDDSEMDEIPSKQNTIEIKTEKLKQDSYLDEAELAWQTQEISKEKQWKNRERTLLISSSGLTADVRFLIQDLHGLLPHSKKDQKLQRKRAADYIDEICYLNSCNNCIYIESHKNKYYYMWILNSPVGPSLKCQLENISTTRELKLTGNCLKGSRPLLSFDKSFSQLPHLKLVKQLLTHAFGTPRNHPKSKPFFDHVFSFTWHGDRIWFRNYQFLNEEEQTFSEDNDIEGLVLVEIGPRFCLNPIKIFEGSLGGKPIWNNKKFLSPVQLRKEIKNHAKYLQRKLMEGEKEERWEDTFKDVPNKMDVGLWDDEDESVEDE